MCLGPSLSPDETLVLLVQAGQYDTAFSIAKAFDLSLTSIFDGLAARYAIRIRAKSLHSDVVGTTNFPTKGLELTV